MPRNQSAGGALSSNSARFRGFGAVAFAAALVFAAMAAAESLWAIAAIAIVTAGLSAATRLWATRNPPRTYAATLVLVYGCTLALVGMSFLELPNASTTPFLIALLILAASYLTGVRDALGVTIVASFGVLGSYLAFVFAAKAGVVPGSGHALIGNADTIELLLMAGRRIVFLFAVFAAGAIARRALDRELGKVQDRERTITAQATELKAAQQRLSALADSVPVAIVETDELGTVTYANRVWCDYLAVSEGSVIGKPWSDFVHPDDLAEVSQLFEACADGPVSSSTRAERDFRLRDPDGRWHWVAGRVAPLPDMYDSKPGHILAVVDVAKRRNTEAELRYLATHDAVTGVLNRSAFELAVEEALARADRYSTKCALVYADIDEFKAINDRFGHAVGDRVLDLVARRIRSTLRDVDTVGRLGGDEFGILMDRVNTREDAELQIRHVTAVLAEPMAADGRRPVTLRLSLGASVYPEDGATFDDLSRAADHRMFRMKRRRSRVDG